MMGEVINFPNPVKPDPNFIYVDEDGVQWFVFSCSYVDHRNKLMSFTLWATDKADAAERLTFIKDGAQLDGQIYGTVDA
jgi:streptogramin lyase